MISTYLNNKYGHAQFEIMANDISETSVNFDVYEITSWSADDKYTPLDKELYLTAYMKWDNCNHFWFGEKDGDDGKQDGYLHICGAESMENHLRLMEYLYSYAFKLMDRNPEEKLTVEVSSKNIDN